MNRDAVNWAILSVVVIVASGGVYYTYQDTRPCVHPVEYSFGTFDSRFNVSAAALAKSAERAASIWNQAAGRPVLRYNPDAALKINLVYDEREENAKLGVLITEKQAESDEARAALDELQDRFAKRQASYNQKVGAVNARGTVTKTEKAALEAERVALTALANTLNQSIASYNASVKALNAVVASYNKSAGRTFEAGQYVRDSQGERINIFTFIGVDQLERVLAHEFGHALDLDHNDDPRSIMYAQNESGNLVPTQTDLAALSALCGS